MNVNGLSAPIKRQRVMKWIKNKTYLYAAYKRFISDIITHTQTASEGIERNFSLKWKPTESWASYAYIRRDRLLIQRL